ncbi:MAG: asparagine synthase (glutamine-hydrolyzing) [Myxococcota bacterium]|nr:asparagine synthase (glutamine-hydrolyzing) [Myxococcota bacterium]
MCGIAGSSGAFPESLLADMNAAIAHRGPDDEGTWSDPSKGVGLAHRRLSIIDLSPLGHQPMWDTTGTVCMVYNGEIYNYRELRKELLADGHAFAGESDSEVVLNLYLRDGAAMLERISGIFALAIWDTRSEELLIARDRMGIKPLYLAETPQGLLFASELKALLCSPEVDRELDPAGALAYLTCLWSPGRRTMLTSVRKLLPGHALRARRGEILREWSFRDTAVGRPDPSWNAEEAARELARRVDVAVERQMVADVPVGAFLSGGLDSSALVSFARKYAPSRLQCFTMDFDPGSAAGEGMTEDIGYARRVAANLDVDLHEVQVGPDMIEGLETMIHHLDEPQADPAAINAMLICQLARERGLTVLLSGTGGDDLLTGYRRHFAVMQEGWWRWLPRPARALLRGATAQLPQSNALTRRISRAFQYSALDGDPLLASYFYHLAPDRAHGLLRDAPPLDEITPERAFRESLDRIPPDTHPLNKVLYLEAKHFLPDHNLNYTDKASMAVGVEVRVPLLDDELVDFAATLPVHMKQRGTTGKWIFKKAMEPYLPHDVIYRRKTGFGVPLRYWMRNQLKDRVDDLLAPERVERRGLFDAAAVQALIREDRAGRIDAAYTILGLVCIEMWCSRFLES